MARFRALSTSPVRVLASGSIGSHFGALNIHGMKVEIMGDSQKRNASGSWAEPTDLPLHRRWARFAGLAVPVLDLRYEREAYKALGRTKRAGQLRAWLSAHPCEERYIEAPDGRA